MNGPEQCIRARTPGLPSAFAIYPISPLLCTQPTPTLFISGVTFERLYAIFLSPSNDAAGMDQSKVEWTRTPGLPSAFPISTSNSFSLSYATFSQPVICHFLSACHMPLSLSMSYATFSQPVIWHLLSACHMTLSLSLHQTKPPNVSYLPLNEMVL